jgi:glycosyltransferase involved in cell wall biosynthesis
MRVAIVHYWLVGMRGGERVLEALCRIFPAADIFTHALDPERISDVIRQHRIKTSFISRFPYPTKLYQAYLPLMPRALEALDLTGYDLVISSEAGPAKGVIPPPDALHICYCHSPMRYLWDQYHIYRSAASLPSRAAMTLFGPSLRQWDVVSAARVDSFVANSSHVAARIRKYWRRDATVIHPPVSVSDFAPVGASELDDYFLWVGELASYKRPDLAVEAFSRSGRRLVVIGGPDKDVRALSRVAGPNVSFLGKVSFDTLQHHLARCRALVFPGEEDFGIVPVEAMASGRPVIAYGRGGVLDTVTDGVTGLLFPEQTVECLMAAIEEFEQRESSLAPTEVLVERAKEFTEDRFRSRFEDLLVQARGADRNRIQ